MTVKGKIKMKRFLVAVLSATLCLVVNLSHAQQNNNQNETPDIDWSSIEVNLSPLERVELEPPRLTNGENGERQVWLNKGQLAPWGGVLLNPAAVAFIISEYQAAFARAEAALERQRLLDMNRLRLEVGRLELRLRSERQQSLVQIEGLQREIRRLEEAQQELINERSTTPFKKFLRIGGGVLGGVAIGIIIGFFASGR